MQLSEVTEQRACKKPPEETPKPDQVADVEDPRPIRLPLRIDDGLVVRTINGPERIASCRIIGAMQDQFILITEPTVKISQTISAVLDDVFLCSYFCDGYLYAFHSRYRNRLMNDIICIEYPTEVEVRQIRKNPRIKVNIETKVLVGGSDKSYLADMTDISHGGCGLVFNQNVPIAKGTHVSLTFRLPNEAIVRNLQAVAARISHGKDGTRKQAGLTFSVTDVELSKIAGFCEFCKFFDFD